MKLALVILGLVAVAAASVIPDNVNKKVADKEFLQKQKALLELVWRVNQPVYFQHIIETANSYNIQANLDKYDNVEAVKKFYNIYKSGMLPKEEIFSVFYKKHLTEAVHLYQVLYSAKDLDTFYKTACWARVNVNAGQFVYALQVALLHRQDTQGLVLPPAYEICPNLFLDNQIIQKTYHARMQYNTQTQQTEEKVVVIPVNHTNLYPAYLYEDEQQHKLMNKVYRYGGDYLQQANPEARLTYFTEDVGINTWYALFHADNAFWLNETNGYHDHKRGERFYYTHQQLLARYYLERLSNDLQDIDTFMWQQPIKVGYAPNLQYPNGQEFPMRPKNIIAGQARTYDIVLVKQLEKRILDAIDLGYVLTQDGQKVSLYDKNGMEILGNMIQGTTDSVHPRYFKHLYQLTANLLAHITDIKHQHGVAPGVLAHYSTALRDPLFYRMINRMNKILTQYKKNLPKYERHELNFPGVKIQSIEVDKLVTYFDQFDIDTTAATLVNKPEDDKNLKIVARQLRLNHKPFTYKIQVESDKAADVMVRVFIGPKYGSQGHMLTLNQKREKMVEIDRFHTQLTVGQNTIQRNSRDSHATVQDFTTMRTLYQQVMGGLEGKNQFYIEENMNQCGFPLRFVLPKGKKGGMPFTFYVTVTKMEKQEQQPTMRCGHMVQYEQDQHAMGYPFDRVIDEIEFNVPNFYEKDVVIFHKRQEDINNQSI